MAVNAALSDRDGAGCLFLNDRNLGDHQVFSQPAGSEASQRKEQSIQLVRGDEFIASRLARIDVLKIDTQGSESNVLVGLLPLLEKSLPNLTMLIEFTPYSLRQAGSSGRELLDLVASLRLPMQLVDHIGHACRPISYRQMVDWIEATDRDVGNQGFVNLLVGNNSE